MHYRPNRRRSASPSQPTNASDSLTGWEMAEAVLGGALVFASGLAWWFLTP